MRASDRLGVVPMSCALWVMGDHVVGRALWVVGMI
jgi:hypothetical protein